MITVPIPVRERLYLPRDAEFEEVYDELRREFTYPNAQRAKLKQLGKWVGNIPAEIKTWDHFDTEQWGECLVLPRGGTNKVRKVFFEFGYKPLFIDNRLSLPPVNGYKNNVTLRPDQKRLAQAMFQRENCLIRSPQGSGKTETALKVIEWILQEAGPVVIIVWESGLMEQWIERIKQRFGIAGDQIGILGGGKHRAAPITVAMQQTLNRKGTQFQHYFGGVVADEVQRFAASTYQKVINRFPARFRIGISADECVASGTMITLGNDVLIPIESIVPGDYVATPIGPRKVTGVFNTGIRRIQTVTTIESNIVLRTTFNTMFASDKKWTESPRHVYLRNVQRQTMQSMWEVNAISLQRRLPHQMQTFDIQRRRNLRDMWRTRTSIQKRVTFATAQRWSMVERTNQGRPPITHGNIEKSIGCKEREASTMGSRVMSQNRLGPRMQTQSSRDSSSQNSKWRIHPIRRTTIRKWETSTTIRNSSKGSARTSRLRTSACSKYGQRKFTSTPLQTRLCSHHKNDRRRNRRFKSPWSRISRQTKRFTTIKTRMGGSTIPGDIRCAVIAHQCDDSHEITIHNPRIWTQTFDLEIEEAHCYYANNILVHNTRKDGRQYLIYDAFGEVADEIKRASLVDKGKIHEVTQRLIPTEFNAEFYVDGEYIEWLNLPAERKNYNALLDMICDDKERNDLIWSFIQPTLQSGRCVMVVTRRVEHARYWDSRIRAGGFTSGLMLGGPENADEFQATCRGLNRGVLNAGVGTIQKIGQGLDIPRWDRGFILTPLASNRQQYEQATGRLSRNHPDKKDAVCYYFWDRHLYPHDKRMIASRYPSTYLWVDGEFLQVSS